MGEVSTVMPFGEVQWEAVGAGAIFILLMIFQGIRGFVTGRRDETPPPIPMMGAVVDAKRMDNLTDQIGISTSATVALCTAMKDNTQAFHAHLAAVVAHRALLESNQRHIAGLNEHAEHLAREMRDLRERTQALRDETRDLRDEMLRQSARK